MSYVVTAPHSKCYDVPERTCDRSAKHLAGHLASNLPSNHVFYADVYRHEHDLNRDMSWDTTFRKQVREIIKADTVLLDVHSFPNISGIWVKFTHNPEIVLLAFSFNYSFCSKLYGCLKDRGISCEVVEASHVNSITREFGLKNSALIEINEDIRDIGKIGETLAKCILAITK